MKNTHSELVRRSIQWLRNKVAVASSEQSSWNVLESPDVVGWEWSGVSHLIECKTSRSDFLADKKKVFRKLGGIGQYRYYAAPKGLLNASDLPEKWGLIETSGKGMRLAVSPIRHDPDLAAERILLVQIARYSCLADWRKKHNIDCETPEAAELSTEFDLELV